jgi:catechol 2,3-dioxygenase-like lactoylglutathione lyase family enzyme
MRHDRSLALEALDHLVLNVRDVGVSAAWYRDVLGMQCDDRAARTSVHFRAQKINLRPVGENTDEWFTARNAVAGSADLCFLTKRRPEEVVSHLENLRSFVEKGPIEAEGACGPLISVYCRDPDGNLIEISSYRSIGGADGN